MRYELSLYNGTQPSNCNYQVISFAGGYIGESGTTTNKKWITERDGRPATVAATEEGGHADILRVDFGSREDNLEGNGWGRVFLRFNRGKLAFLNRNRQKMES